MLGPVFGLVVNKYALWVLAAIVLLALVVFVVEVALYVGAILLVLLMWRRLYGRQRNRWYEWVAAIAGVSLIFVAVAHF